MSSDESMDGLAIATTAKGTATKLFRDAEHSAPFTGVIEAFRNFRQKLDRTPDSEMLTWRGKTQRDEALMTVDQMQVFTTDGTQLLKSTYWNTAPRMTREEMELYFTTIGTTVEEFKWTVSHRTGSYGQGLRQGELPYNKYGFVVLAVNPGLDKIRDENVTGDLMWIAYDEVDEEFKCLRLPTGEVEDEEDGIDIRDIVVPIDTINGIPFLDFIQPQVRRWGGMVFVRLGNSLEDETLLMSRDEDEATALEKTITERIFDPSTLRLKIGFTPDKATVEKRLSGEVSSGGGFFERKRDGVYIRIDSRKLRNHLDWFDGQPNETLSHPDGTTFQIGLREKGDRRMPNYGNGFTEVRYGDDVHQLWRSRTHVETLREFGISYASVAKKVALVITPPQSTTGREKFAVEQDTTRMHLMVAGSGGTMLSDSRKPREWAEWLHDRLPQFIRDAQDKAAADEHVDRQDHRDIEDAVRAAIKGRVAARALHSDPEGEFKGDPSEEKTKTSSKTEDGMATADPEGDLTGVSTETEIIVEGEGKHVENVNPDPGSERVTEVDTDITPPEGEGVPATTDVTSIPVIPLTESTTGATTGKAKRAAKHFEVIWHAHDAFLEKMGEDHDGDPIVVNVTGREVDVDEEHVFFVGERDFYARWAEGKIKIGKHIAPPIVRMQATPAMISEAVQRAYHARILGVVTGTIRGVASVDAREKLLSVETMEASLQDVYTLQSFITSTVGDWANLRKYGKWVSAADKAAGPADDEEEAAAS